MTEDEYRRRLIEALRTIPAHRLESLADWLDIIDKRDGRDGTEVQDDLRLMAQRSRELIGDEVVI